MLPLNNKLALAGLVALAITAYGAIVLACCSLDRAEFTNTIGWVGEGIVGNKIVHILGYQNKATNRAFTKDGPKIVMQGNAMLLPIPSKTRMTSANFIDASKYPDVMQDMRNAVIPPSKSVTNGTPSRGVEAVQVFTKGMYTVVLAQNAEAIPAALSQVPAEKRPKINKEIFAAYSKWYPGWTFALCCFKDTVSKDPMIWWYEPKNPHSMFFPGLDAHNGRPPDLAAEVDVDHCLIVSSDKMKSWTVNTPFSELRKVQYRSRPATGTVLGDLLPDVVAGRQYKTRMSNGDFIFETGDVRGGRCNPQRKLPPGAGSGETHVPGID